MRPCWPVPVLLALASCSAPPPPPPPAPAALRLAVRADILGLFPRGSFLQESYTVDAHRNVYEGLVARDPRLRMVPAVAARWETPDDRTYLFTLRPGLVFSDGQALTVADVVTSLQKSWTEEFGAREYLKLVESIRALPDGRVEIRTKRPYRVLLQDIHMAFVTRADAFGAGNAVAPGTGPYRFVRHERGQFFELQANPHGRGPRPAFASARFDVVPDGAERVRRLTEGTADVIDHVPMSALAGLVARPDVRVVEQPGTRVLYLGMRMDRPPFSDPRVREAVALALDREELIRRALGGHATPSDQMVPPAIVGHDPDRPRERPDRARALALLAEAGHPSGFTVRLDGPRNRYPNDVEILAEVARQLQEVGIKAEVNALDKKEFFPLTRRRDSDFHLIGWACDTGDAGEILRNVFQSSVPGGTENSTGISDPELDRLIADVDATPEEVERGDALRHALARVYALRPTVALVVPHEVVAHSTRVVWDAPPNGALLLQTFRPAP